MAEPPDRRDLGAALDLELGPPPDGYVERRGPRGVVWLATRHAEALVAAGAGPEPSREFDLADVGGREPLRRLVLGERTVLVREFTHGGLAGRALGLCGLARTFRDPRRPFVELALCRRLAALGVRVPEVAFARARHGGLGWHLSLGTLRLGEGARGPARDLGEWLGLKRRGAVSARAARRLASAAGALVGALHAVSFLHADLQPANLFVLGDPDEATPEVVALDLDRSRFLAEPDVRALHGNLARLWRHLRRREQEYGPALTRTDRARFLRAWAERLAPAAPEAAWRAAWRAVDAREARTRGVHRLGWALGRALGARPDARAAGGPR